jgi:uncharacterized protein (DUF2164 family)
MKTTAAFLVLFFAAIAGATAQEYAIVTSVESIIPMGLGRSRLIYNKEDMNTANYTRNRADGNSSAQLDEIKRKEIKVEDFEETKLLNFFSATGINFQNIASNDAMISAKLNEMTAAGWTLAFVVTGVESNAGTEDGEGIFVTRYIFKR